MELFRQTLTRDPSWEERKNGTRNGNIEEDPNQSKQTMEQEQATMTPRNQTSYIVATQCQIIDRDRIELDR